MAEPLEILKGARSILVIDWPSSDVPDTLVAAGFSVFIKGGPRPDDYAVLELRDNGTSRQPLGRAPHSIDLVYAHRPCEELPALVAQARALGARAVWYQSGLFGDGLKDPRGCWLSETATRELRELAQSAGLQMIIADYIADAARKLRAIHRSL